MAKLKITPRQTEVVRLASLGCDNGEIANILKLSVSTVDNHKAAAMKALNVDKATLLVRKAIETGITNVKERLTAAEKRRRGSKGRKDGWN